MNAETLYIKKFKGLGEWEYKDSKIYFCEFCRQVYAREEDANKCCVCYICKDPVLSYQGKNDSRDRNGLAAYHGCCWDKNQREVRKRIEKEKFNKATKLDIKDYTGYLLDNETATDDYQAYFENYFENHDLSCIVCGEETVPVPSKQDERSHLICKNSECLWVSPEYEVIDEIYYLFAPEYIWAADFKPVELDLGRILERATEDHHESVDDYLKGVRALELAVDNFNQLNLDSKVGSYYESNTLALINVKDYVKELYNK